jgi:LysR family glycine cleavage system transcriptional activator
MPVQFRGLRAFCEASRTGSFKAAADELCVTSSAVSHQIRALEDYLGVKLFERRTRSIELTSAGRSYFRTVAPLLRSIDDASEEFKCSPDKTSLRVQMPDFFASEMFVPKMSDFSDRYPEIDLQIETLPVKVSAEITTGDVVVVLTGRQPEFPIAEKLFPVRYVPACSRARFECWHKQGFTALEQATLLVHKARPHAWERWAEEAGVSAPAPKQIIRLDTMFALARATEQGVGIGLIPMPVSANWFGGGAIRRLFDQDLVTRDHYCVVATGNSEHPEATRLLWQWMVDSFRQT